MVTYKNYLCNGSEMKNKTIMHTEKPRTKNPALARLLVNKHQREKYSFTTFCRKKNSGKRKVSEKN